MKKEWQILQPDIRRVEKIERTLNCHPVIASILVSRGILSEKDALNFLNPSVSQLSQPFSIKDIDAATDRILTAIRNEEKILIFGDYDVDGITATTILLDFFRSVGAEATYYIPHRIKEGFGLRENHIPDVALPGGTDLIITADCGSDSSDAVKAAKDAGIDVIITDHHIVSDTIPPAAAVVNPKRKDCPSGLQDLAGVGVAFYLLICLRKKLRDINFWQNRPEPNLKNSCDLVALGTLADMVPLTKENRILTTAGFDIIHSSHRPGLKALMAVSRINRHAVDTEDIVFGLVPRLNAAGRMDHAAMSIELLTAKDIQPAMEIAHSLDQMNQERRRMENEMLMDIQNYLTRNPHLLRGKTLVLARQDWHFGVVGIAASRVMKKYSRPVVLITTADGIGKGSARSVTGINLYESLSACSDDLEKFGGHAMAAGLQIKTEKIDRFVVNFEHVVRYMGTSDDFLPKIFIDSILDFDDISEGLIDELKVLKPFGNGNPEPLFMSQNIQVVSSKIVGKHHRRMTLKQSGGRTEQSFDAIQFNIDTGIPLKDRFDKIAFRLRRNRWNGRKNLQLIIEET